MDDRRPQGWQRRPAWINEARRQPRFRDVRTVLARVGDDEFLGKTCDLSLGGAALALQGVRPEPRTPVHCDVVFETGIVGLMGTVVHTRPARWGSLVGILWAPRQGEARAYLARRYADDSGGLGSVK